MPLRLLENIQQKIYDGNCVIQLLKLVEVEYDIKPTVRTIILQSYIVFYLFNIINRIRNYKSIYNFKTDQNQNKDCDWSIRFYPEQSLNLVSKIATSKNIWPI